MPKRNRHDVDELPPEAKKRLSFHFVERVEEVLGLAFAEDGEECAGRGRRRAKKARKVKKKSAASKKKVARKKSAKRASKKAGRASR